MSPPRCEVTKKSLGSWSRLSRRVQWCFLKIHTCPYYLADCATGVIHDRAVEILCLLVRSIVLTSKAALTSFKESREHCLRWIGTVVFYHVINPNKCIN